MGWLFPYDAHTKEILVKDILRRNNTTFQDGTVTLNVLKHTLKGNNLWMVIERLHPATEKYGSRIVFIMLYKLAYDRDSGTWGYKEMDASMCPYENDCPVKYLDMVTEDCKTSNYPDFEKMIREVAEKRNKEQRLKKSFAIGKGDVIHFNQPLKYGGIPVFYMKVSYTEKRGIIGYGYNSNNDCLASLGLIRAPKMDYWTKIVKENGEIIRAKQEEKA